MGNKIFTGFLIIALSVSFWFLPVAAWLYAWQTDIRTDTFYVSTGPGVTTSAVTLLKPIYDNDTSTISLFSFGNTDALSFSSYNTTSRVLALAGLSGNVSRNIEVAYDVAAFQKTSVYNFFASFALWFTYIVFILFPLAGLVYVFRDAIRGWFS